MKIASTTICIIAAVIPLVATFAPGFPRTRPALDLQAKASADVVSAYQAYKRVKPVPTTAPEEPFAIDLPIPEIPMQPIIESPPAPLSPPPMESSLSDSFESAKKSISSLQTTTADQFSDPFKGVNDFVKVKQELFAQAAAERASSVPSKIPTLGEMFKEGFASHRATFTETSVSLPEGKVPTLAEYILGGFQSPVSSVDNLADSKARFVHLVENTFALFGQTAPANMEMNLPEGVTPETAVAFAVGGVGLLVIAGQNNQKTPLSPMTVEEEKQEGALFELSTDVKKMAAQIEKLAQETKELRQELKEAKEKINKKELEISKEKLKTADGELKLKRELEKVETKLRESEARNKALEEKLATSAAGVQVKPAVPAPAPKVTAKSEPVLAENKAHSPIKSASPKPAPVPEPVVPAPAPKVAPKADPVLAEIKAPSPKKSTGPKPAPVPEPVVPAPAPKVAAKSEPVLAEIKAPSPKKSTGPKGSAAKAASPAAEETPVLEATKEKAKATSKATAKKATPAAASTEWSSLSKSTLFRKTVKELTEYLGSKGVETNDSDGKPLKKDLLVDAVMAL